MIVVFNIKSIEDAYMAADIAANIISGKRHVDFTVRWELKRGLDWSVVLEALSARDEIPRAYIDDMGGQLLDEGQLDIKF